MELIPTLDLIEEANDLVDLDVPRTTAEEASGRRKVYIETYGCQMNVSDS